MKYLTLPLLFSASLILASCTGTGNKNEDTEESTDQEMAAPDTDSAETTEKKKPASPKQEAMAMVGSNHIHIDYSSPSVRGRVIWGGLVAYNKVWSTGAHKATSINFPEAVIINGTNVPAGKYGFFTIPGESVWTVILNKNWEMHLADDYQEDQDIIRFDVTPEKLNEIQEALVYEVESIGDKTGNITVAWEYLKISFEVTNK